jgi:hypothetical protein
LHERIILRINRRDGNMVKKTKTKPRVQARIHLPKGLAPKDFNDFLDEFDSLKTVKGRFHPDVSEYEDKEDLKAMAYLAFAINESRKQGEEIENLKKQVLNQSQEISNLKTDNDSLKAFIEQMKSLGTIPQNQNETLEDTKPNVKMIVKEGTGFKMRMRGNF